MNSVLLNSKIYFSIFFIVILTSTLNYSFGSNLEAAPYASLTALDGSSSANICDGESATLEVTLEGMAPWTLEYYDGSNIVNLNITSSPYTFEVDVASTYTLLNVYDFFGNCGAVSGSVDVTIYDSPLATISGNENICNGTTADVTIQLTGTPPFEIIYTNGTDNINATANNYSFIFAASPGTYELVSVSDANCIGSVSGTATVSTFPNPTATIAGNANVCNGSTADITIQLTGNAPYEVIYTDGTDNIDVTISNNSYTFSANAGTYELVSVSDANCTGIVSGTAIITNSPSPTATITGDANICAGTTADVTIQLTGTAPFEVTYTNGTNNISETVNSNSFTFAAVTGTYELVSVADVSCTGTVSGTAIITNSPSPTATIAGSTNICEGTTTDVTIQLTGTAPFEVTYTNGTDDTSETVNSNSFTFAATTGTYELVSVADVSCTGTVSGTAIITNSPNPTATIAGNTNICAGTTADVTIQLTGTAPFEVTYTNGTNNISETVNSNSFTFAAATGTYELVSVADVSCTGTVSGIATITNSPSPTAIIAGSANICEGTTTDVTIQLTGTAPFEVTYTNGTNNTSETVNSNSFTFTATTGTYELVSVADANCTGSVSGIATISQSNGPTASLSGDYTICEGNTVDVEVHLTGESPWIFTYSDGITNTEVNTNTNSYTLSLDEGSYTLISVTDAGNCEGNVSGQASVSIGNEINGSIVLNESYCFDDSRITLGSSLEGTVKSISWVTDGLGELLNANTPNATYIPSNKDNLINFELTVTNNCSSKVLEATTRIINLDAGFTISPEPIDNQFKANIIYTFTPNTNKADSYLWDFGDGVTSTSQISVHSYESDIELAVVMLTVSTESCPKNYSDSFTLIPNRNLYIPNVFNPLSNNPDNSKVKVYGENISSKNFSFEIYNRWGLEVYHTTSLEEAQTIGWNGEQKNREKENNVFTYTLRGQFNDGEEIEKTGTVTLVK